MEGTQVGAYRVLRKIGDGGMGSVWLAEHVMLGRRAAIEVLHPELSIRSEMATTTTAARTSFLTVVADLTCARVRGVEASRQRACRAPW